MRAKGIEDQRKEQEKENNRKESKLESGSRREMREGGK